MKVCGNIKIPEFQLFLFLFKHLDKSIYRLEILYCFRDFCLVKSSVNNESNKIYVTRKNHL